MNISCITRHKRVFFSSAVWRWMWWQIQYIQVDARGRGSSNPLMELLSRDHLSRWSNIISVASHRVASRRVVSVVIKDSKNRRSQSRVELRHAPQRWRSGAYRPGELADLPLERWNDEKKTTKVENKRRKNRQWRRAETTTQRFGVEHYCAVF